MKKKIIAIILILCLTITLTSCKFERGELNCYDIEIDYNEENSSATITQTVKIINNEEEPLDDIYFNIFTNAYREGAKHSPIPTERSYIAYPKGKSYGNLSNLEVLSECGDKLKYQLCGEDKNFLKIPLPQPLREDKKTNLTLKYTIKIPTVSHRFGIVDGTISLGNFYPILAPTIDGKAFESVYESIGDPFISDFANYNVSITLPSNYVVSSSGEEIKREEVGSNTKFTYKLNNSIDFAMSFSKKYKTLTRESLGTDITYYYYGDENAQQTLETAIQCFEYFSNTYGKYSYKTLNISQTSLLQGGMEYPAQVFISDKLESDYLMQTVVHEIAHQWWYAGVASNQIDEAYIDEGLAQYSTIMFFKKHSENENYMRIYSLIQSSIDNTIKSYADICNLIGKKIDNGILLSLSEFGSEFEYTYKTYILSLNMFRDLANYVGEEKFNLALGELYRKNKGKYISGTHIADCVYSQTAVDISPLMQSYLDGSIFTTNKKA